MNEICVLLCVCAANLFFIFIGMITSQSTLISIYQLSPMIAAFIIFPFYFSRTYLIKNITKDRIIRFFMNRDRKIVNKIAKTYGKNYDSKKDLYFSEIRNKSPKKLTPTKNNRYGRYNNKTKNTQKERTRRLLFFDNTPERKLMSLNDNNEIIIKQNSVGK